MNPESPPQDPASITPETVTRTPPPLASKPPSVGRSSFSPVVTYTLLAITIVIYLVQIGTSTVLGVDLPAELGLKINEAILQGQLWRLITPVLLHGSIIHVGFNMYALHLFGPGLERHFGRARFLTLYILSGFAGNVVSFIFSPANSLGSSTAIFGLFGAQGVFIYQNQAVLGSNARRALNQIIFLAAVNLFIGLAPFIDNWGHVGGLIGGSLFAWLGGPLLRVEGIFPALKILDERESSDVIRAGIWVTLLFTFLAAVTTFFRLS